MINVKDAEGVVLDWLVAKVENAAWAAYDEALYSERDLPPRPSEHLRDYEFGPDFAPSTNPAQAWPIIDRAKIDIEHANSWPPQCFAKILGDEPYGSTRVHGPTSLVAAMRCFVAVNLGAEVEVPDDLLKPKP